MSGLAFWHTDPQHDHRHDVHGSQAHPQGRLTGWTHPAIGDLLVLAILVLLLFA